MATGGQAYLDARMKANQAALAATGIGLYYGNKSEFKRMSPEEQARWVAANRTAPTAQMPSESSCINWAMENVAAAYKAAGMEARWSEIRQTVIYNPVKKDRGKGTVLAAELKKDGWEAVYFNPDVSNTPPDPTKPGHPPDGEHKESAKNTRRGLPYYGVAVDHQAVNYSPNASTGTKADTSGLDKLSQVPFFFGVSRGGEHTFVGRNGQLNELHWRSMPNDPRTLEERPLQSIPQGYTYGSGVVMVPPGTWPKN